MDILVGTDPVSGLSMYREIDYFVGGVKEPMITVWYYQWLLSNTLKLDMQRKKYVVIDIPEVTYQAPPILVTPEVLDGEGNVVESAVYQDSPIVVITPASLGYTAWKQKLIIQQYVGKKLGDDIIIGTINAKLASMPFDAIDGFIGN